MAVLTGTPAMRASPKRLFTRMVATLYSCAHAISVPHMEREGKFNCRREPHTWHEFSLAGGIDKSYGATGGQGLRQESNGKVYPLIMPGGPI